MKIVYGNRRVVNPLGEESMKSPAKVVFASVAFAILALVEIDMTKPFQITVMKEAQAVVGMPATPLSVAGVARRTAVRSTAAASAAAKPPPAATAPAFKAGTVISALPAGCASIQLKGVNYFNCQGTYFRPAYQGQNLVYIVETP
jgi:hypothetical protein